jgi:hypothetical protein
MQEQWMNEGDLIELHDHHAYQACIARVVRDRLDKAAMDRTLGVPDTPEGRRAIEDMRRRLDLVEIEHSVRMFAIRARLDRRPLWARRRG